MKDNRETYVNTFSILGKCVDMLKVQNINFFLHRLNQTKQDEKRLDDSFGRPASYAGAN